MTKFWIFVLIFFPVAKPTLQLLKLRDIPLRSPDLHYKNHRFFCRVGENLYFCG